MNFDYFQDRFLTSAASALAAMDSMDSEECHRDFFANLPVPQDGTSDQWPKGRERRRPTPDSVAETPLFFFWIAVGLGCVTRC